jgi:hypothetical protein
MKKYILLLLLIFSIPVFSQVQTWYDISNKEIPYKGNTNVYLDGTIINISGSYYFRDISGNNRHFLITNYDFPVGWKRGLPYKSAATISAPIGDTILIAADLNSFLYNAADSVPNQIPVVSLFQNIDHENKFFCLHQKQILNENGVEFAEPCVLEIVLYNTAKTGTQLTTCNTYFKVPTEQTSNVRWCSKAGNDSPNTGTKLSPWLTQVKVNSGSTNGDLTYTKTGTYKETNYLNISKLIEFRGLGLNTLQSTGTTYVFITSANGSKKLTGWVIDGETNTTTVAYLCRNNETLDKCLIKNAATTVLKIDAVANGGVISNTIISGAKPIVVNNTGYFNTCYFDLAYFSFASTCDTLIILNSRINYNRVATDITIATDKPVTIKGNEINITTAYNFFTSNQPNFTNDFDFSYNKVTGLNFTNVGVLQVIKSFDTVTANNNVVNLTNGQFTLFNSVRNTFTNNNLITTNGAESVEIYNSTADILGTHTIYGNKIFGKYDIGHIVKIGDEATTIADNTLTSVTINNNYVRGNKYYYPGNNVTCHGLFVGFQGVPIIIKHNYLSYSGLIGFKGTNTDYSSSHFFGNVVKSQQNYGFVFKGSDSVNITNNTFIENGADELYFTENAGGDPAKGNIIKNNIFINTTGLLVNFLTTSCASNTLDFNIYYSTVAKPFSINGVIKTWSEWQALGYDQHSIFLTTEQFNNLFTNYAAGDYSLKAGSTAINSGTSISAPYNIGLDASTNWGSDTQLPIITTKTNGTNDIGAYIH